MYIERITYKRTKNLGNCENEVLEMSCILTEDDDYKQAALDLMQSVHDNLRIEFDATGEVVFQNYYLKTKNKVKLAFDIIAGQQYNAARFLLRVIRALK